MGTKHAGMWRGWERLTYRGGGDGDKIVSSRHSLRDTRLGLSIAQYNIHVSALAVPKDPADYASSRISCMPSTTTPSGRSLHRLSSGSLVTWVYKATKLQTTCASVHFTMTQWTSRRRRSIARLVPSTAIPSSGSGRRNEPPPTPEPTTEHCSRPLASLPKSPPPTRG